MRSVGRPTAKDPLAQGPIGYPLKASPPSAHTRARVGGKLDIGVKALNAFVTCCKGQRMGIFAGSGVGKSTMLAMLARNTDADAIVIGLVGERGRELKEFIEDDLGPEGLRRSAAAQVAIGQASPEFHDDYCRAGCTGTCYADERRG